MRSLIQHRFGDPAEVVDVAELETPEPGPGQVRVRTLLSPIHNHDLWTVRGQYGVKPTLPAPGGTEAVGIVDALGPGVTGVEVGQRVTTAAFGTWAEYFLAKADGVIAVPEQLPDEVAAQLVSMPFSAISLLEFLDLAPGDRLVQNTANGAVGRMVAQLGRARGLQVVGLVRRSAGVAELADQGITDVVATDDENWRDQVDRLTGGAGFAAAVDSVGGAAAGDLLSLLADGATLVAFGAMGSPTMSLSSGELIFKQAVVRGFWGAKVIASTSATDRARLFGELVERIVAGELTLPVASIHPLAEFQAAVAASAVPGRVGKVLLAP